MGAAGRAGETGPGRRAGSILRDTQTRIAAAAVAGRGLRRKERVHRKTYSTRDDARADIFDYIEAFYNSRRRHSTLGQISPIAFERSYAGLA
jgi:transposase InsO family protein